MQAWLRGLRWFTRVGALLALCGVVVEFGFGLPEGSRTLVHGLELTVVGIFTLTALAHLIGARDRRQFLRDNWLDAALLAVLAVELGYFLTSGLNVLQAHVYLVSVQVLIVARMLIGMARAQERLAGPRLRPALLLVTSFVALVLLGTGALMMPLCRAPGADEWSFLDALFTSTSAVCVTGLTVRDIGTELSQRGQTVLLVLIQLGGLGLVTIGTAITVIERSTPKLRFVAVAGNLTGVHAFSALRRFLAYTLVITLALELTGAAILAGSLDPATGSLGERLWWGGFHSISAFCNAGFGLSRDSLVPWADRPEITLTFAGLIVLGGLGFPVMIDLLRFQVTTLQAFQRMRLRMRQLVRVRWFTLKWGFFPWLRSPISALHLPRASHLQINTKIVLLTSGILLFSGALLFYLSEREGVLEGRGVVDGAIQAIFHSVTARTAGFNTVDLTEFAAPTLLLTILLMAIGAAAVSTGGGMKTGTVAVVFLTVRAMMRDREHVEVFGRTIPARIVNASISVVALYSLGVISVTTILAATQEDIDFLDLLFESVSALSTVGLTHGVTPRLDTTGRLVIAAAMLIGRVGPLAIVWTFLARGKALRYRYPEEEVVIS